MMSIRKRKKKCSPLDDLDADLRILSELIKADLSTFDAILSLSIPDIERLTKLSNTESKGVKKVVAETVLQKSRTCQGHTALDLYHKSCTKGCNSVKLTTGCPVLDKFFKGGIISRGITELCGVSASGKTQVCLQLCLAVQLPLELGGLNAGAVYICTEDVFPNKRLYQMISSFTQIYKNQMPSNISFGDNIYIEHIPDVESLQSCVHNRLPSLLTKGTVRLVIIDSVAALFRCEYSSSQLYTRSQHLASFAARLIRLNQDYNIPVVCVNQVTASMNDNSKSVVPSLGLTWANQVTTRVMLTRRDHYTRIHSDRSENCVGNHGDDINRHCNHGDDKNGQCNHGDDKHGHCNHGYESCDHNMTCNHGNIQYEQTVVRTMEIMYAPHLPNWVCEFKVDQNGVSGVLE